MRKNGTYGSNKFFIQLNLELRESVSFMAMPLSAQSVLIDYLFEYNKATGFDTREMKKINALSQSGNRRKVPGVKYSFGMCNLDISQRTFRTAMATLEKHGFIRKYQTKNGSYNVYVPSSKWRQIDIGTLDEKQAQRISSVIERRRKHYHHDQMEMDFGPQEFINKTSAKFALVTRANIAWVTPAKDASVS